MIDFNKIEKREDLKLSVEEYLTLKKAYENIDKICIREWYTPLDNSNPYSWNILVEKHDEFILSSEKDKILQDKLNELVKKNRKNNAEIRELEKIKDMTVKEFKKFKKENKE